MSTYTRQPITFVRGEGAWLWDSAGERYLDATAGVAVCNLGHAHPKVSAAICEQAGRLLHTSNLYTIDAQVTLAERLLPLTGMETAFFCNSGTEANEAAIKLARFYAHSQGNREPLIVVMDQAFHGRTLGALSATGSEKLKTGFAPLLPGFVRVPFDDIAALEAVARQHPGIVAVLLEPIQGESGVRMPHTGYLAKVRALCERFGWLMMLDEVQTGMGRTGAWLGCQHEGILPDVMCLAKGLGNGFPIGACLARGQAARSFTPGAHGSTFGGNPLACATATAVIDALEAEGLIAHAAQLGQWLLEGFTDRLQGADGVVSIRGQGLMIGIELNRPCGELVAQARARHLLINVTAERVIRLVPPLVITQDQAEMILNTVCERVQRL